MKRFMPLLACVLGAVGFHRAEAAMPIKVCIDKANPTHRMDERVAREALHSQGYTVETVTFIGHGKEASDGFPISKFAKLTASRCKLIMGFPVDVSDPNLPPNVQSTHAYATTGFVLVERGNGKLVALDDLPKGSEVGIAQLDTWAGLLFSTHPNIVMHVYPRDADMLADLANHKITAGLTWQPLLQAYEARHRDHERLNAGLLPGKHMRWHLVALFAPGSNAAAEAFNKGLVNLAAKRRLEKLIKPYAPVTPVPAMSSLPLHGRPSGICGSDSAASQKSKASPDLPTPPALYSKAQATRGRIEYLQNCAMCHGPLLDGQMGGFPGPALKGEDFADPSYDFHVSDIFNFVAKLMPAATPGSLSRDQDVQIMAYLLKENGYPSGKTELTYEGAERSKVPIRYYGE